MKFVRSVSGYGLFPESLIGRRFAPRFVFNPDDGTGAGGGGGDSAPPAAAPPAAPPTAGGDQYTELKAALASQRALTASLETQLKGFGGLTPEAVSAAVTENETLKTTVAELGGKLQTTIKDSASSRLLAGVLESERQIMAPYISSLLVVGDDGVVKSKDGKTVDELAAELRTAHPTKFYAETLPTGAGGAGGNGGQNKGRVVAVKNGVITGVDPDDVIKGKVSLS